MTFSIKSGVRLIGMRPEMSYANTAVVGVFTDMGFDCVMTAGVDGKHSRASAHYTGRAADYRTRHVPEDQHVLLGNKLREALGPEFDVLIETTPPHVHVEYDPKEPVTA